MSEDEVSTGLSIKDIEEKVISEVIDVELGDAQLIISHHLHDLGSEYLGTELELFLQSYWNYCESIRVISEEGDFLRAVELGNAAIIGFEKLNFDELESTARAITAYAYAITELKKLNISRYLELHKEIEDYLKKAGQFGLKLNPMIDHMKPEAEFIGGVQALQLGDLSTAKVLISQAAEGSERLANKYYDQGSSPHSTFCGVGKAYSALLKFHVIQQDLINLELDSISCEHDVSLIAREAETLLSQGDLKNVTVRATYQLSRALAEILEVLQMLHSILYRCLNSTFKPDSKDFSELRYKTRLAIEYLSGAGQSAAPFIRSCDQLLIRIKNLQRLSKPSKKDFGIFSGLISCALFIPLFIIASYINYVFGMGVDTKILFLTMIGLSLIGGFGFGAIRFKGFIFSGAKGSS